MIGKGAGALRAERRRVKLGRNWGKFSRPPNPACTFYHFAAL